MALFAAVALVPSALMPANWMAAPLAAVYVSLLLYVGVALVRLRRPRVTLPVSASAGVRVIDPNWMFVPLNPWMAKLLAAVIVPPVRLRADRSLETPRHGVMPGMLPLTVKLSDTSAARPKSRSELVP